MLLTLDMGNTNLTLGIFDGEKLLFSSRIATDIKKMEDQYAIEFLDIFRLHGVSPSSFEGAIIGSVVPVLDQRIRSAVYKLTGIMPLQIGPGIKTGIDLRVDPAQLGADLLVGVVAAKARYGIPCMVWDLGTATKVTVLDKDGRFLGGAIMPGVQTGLQSLVTNTSLLPNVGIEAPGRVVCPDTVGAMQSGLVYGTASMIDGMSDRIEQELGYPVQVVVTGGLSREIAANCRRKLHYDENLLLEGLRLVYIKNRK